MPDTPDLEAIAARCAQASPGPWVYWQGELVSLHPDPERLHSLTPSERSAWLVPEDAQFAAAARTDIPALLGHIRRLERYREALGDILALPTDLEAGLTAAQFIAERTLLR